MPACGCVGANFNEAALEKARQDALEGVGYTSSSSEDLPGALRLYIRRTGKL